MSVAKLSKESHKPEPVAYSDAALRNNAVVVEYCRTSMAALSGSTAGVLGLTGLYGFAFYVFAVVSLWVMFMVKTGPKWSKYYVSRQSVLTNGFFGALFTYVLFWTFIYGMCVARLEVSVCDTIGTRNRDRDCYRTYGFRLTYCVQFMNETKTGDKDTELIMIHSSLTSQSLYISLYNEH